MSPAPTSGSAYTRASQTTNSFGGRSSTWPGSHWWVVLQPLQTLEKCPEVFDQAASRSDLAINLGIRCLRSCESDVRRISDLWVTTVRTNTAHACNTWCRNSPIAHQAIPVPVRLGGHFLSSFKGADSVQNPQQEGRAGGQSMRATSQRCPTLLVGKGTEPELRRRPSTGARAADGHGELRLPELRRVHSPRRREAGDGYSAARKLRGLGPENDASLAANCRTGALSLHMPYTEQNR